MQETIIDTEGIAAQQALAQRLEDAASVTRIDWSDDSWYLYAGALPGIIWRYDHVYRVTFADSYDYLVIALKLDIHPEHDDFERRYQFRDANVSCVTLEEVETTANRMIAKGELTGPIIRFFECVGNWWAPGTEPRPGLRWRAHIIRAYEYDAFSRRISRVNCTDEDCGMRCSDEVIEDTDEGE